MDDPPSIVMRGSGSPVAPHGPGDHRCQAVPRRLPYATIVRLNCERRKHERRGTCFRRMRLDSGAGEALPSECLGDTEEAERDEDQSAEREQVETQLQRASDAEHSLRKIAQLGNQTRALEQIADSSTQQLQLAQDVISAVEQLSGLAKANRGHAESIG